MHENCPVRLNLKKKKNKLQRGMDENSSIDIENVLPVTRLKNDKYICQEPVMSTGEYHFARRARETFSLTFTSS